MNDEITMPVLAEETFVVTGAGYLDDAVSIKRSELATLSGLIATLMDKATTKRALTPDFGPLEGIDQLLIEVRILFGMDLMELRSTARDSCHTAAKAYATWRMRAAGWKYKDIDKFFDRKDGTSSTYLYHYNKEWWERYIIRSYADEARIQQHFESEMHKLAEFNRRVSAKSGVEGSSPE